MRERWKISFEKSMKNTGQLNDGIRINTGCEERLKEYLEVYF